jgi:hypothetical protein
MRKLYKFYLRLFHAKAIAEKAADYFFFLVFTDFSNANFGRIRQKTVVLIFWYLLHGIFPGKCFLLSGRLQGSHFPVSYSFCLLKSY